MNKPNPYHNSLYVRNLHDSVDDVRLRQEFSVYGKVTSSKVIMKFGKSKGFGFVAYARYDQAVLAKDEMNGRYLASLPVFVSWAIRRVERRSLTAERYLAHFNEIQNKKRTHESRWSSHHSVPPTTSTQYGEENKKVTLNSPFTSGGPAEIITSIGLSNTHGYTSGVLNVSTTLCSDNYAQRWSQDAMINGYCNGLIAPSYHRQGISVAYQEQKYPPKLSFTMAASSNCESMPRQILHPCDTLGHLFTCKRLPEQLAVVSNTESTSTSSPLIEQEIITNNIDFQTFLTEVDLFNIREIARPDTITTTINEEFSIRQASLLLPKDILDELGLSNLDDHSLDQLLDTTNCIDMPIYNMVMRESDYTQGNERAMAWHYKVADENKNVIAGTEQLNKNPHNRYGTMRSTKTNFRERPNGNQGPQNVEKYFPNNPPSFMSAENHVDGNLGFYTPQMQMLPWPSVNQMQEYSFGPQYITPGYNTVTGSIRNGFHVPIPPATEQGIPASQGFMMSEGNNIYSGSIPYRQPFQVPIMRQDMMMPTSHGALNGYLFTYQSPSAQQVPGAGYVTMGTENFTFPGSPAGQLSNAQVIPLVAQGVVLRDTVRTVNFKFNSNVINAPKGYGFWQPAQQQQITSTLNMLAAMDPRESREMLGEKLYTRRR